MSADTIFLTAASPETEPAVRLLLASLRTFGGALTEAPVWVFTEDPAALESLADAHTRLLPLALPPSLSAYPFSRTVAACARAEELAPAGTRTLAWIDPACLVVQPPVLFDLGAEYDAAFRPVHIRNVGQPAAEPLDAFWSGIYTALGLTDVPLTVTSFIDGQTLRAYFNSHAFAVNPRHGLLRRWYEHFGQLAADGPFQAACTDPRHPVFLFQAILGTLAATTFAAERVRILPPTYNYPYNLHARVPAEHRPAALNDLVCFTYEGRYIHPGAVADIQIREPLRSWLESRM